MDNLETRLKSVFFKSIYHTGKLSNNSKFLQMIVPVDMNVFEIPVCGNINQYHIEQILNAEGINLIFPLNFDGRTCYYKTASAQIKDVISTNISSSLVKFQDNKTEDIYYGCNGLILDSKFSPILMCSWRIEKILKNGEYTYYISPIMRVDPSVILNKKNSIEKFIANKVLNTALEITNVTSRWLDYAYQTKFITVEISPCPFDFKEVVVPSYITTKRELLDTVLDNLDDIICQ